MKKSLQQWKRFDVELLIIHPTLEPAEISEALGLNGQISHRAGDQRKTPTGRLLDAPYSDTRWRHSRRHRTRNQWFAIKVDELVDQLSPHRAFLHKLRAAGGRASIIVQFLGDGYFGDEISIGTLKRMAALKLDFGFESHVDVQSRIKRS